MVHDKVHEVVVRAKLDDNACPGRQGNNGEDEPALTRNKAGRATRI